MSILAAVSILSILPPGGDVEVVRDGRAAAAIFCNDDGKEAAGEIFVELGLSVKWDSPFPRTLIAELANGSVGYVPTQRAYAQGNYEVVSARGAEGSGELLVAAAVRLLKANYYAK